MRGKVTPAAVENYFNRITPAHAGKSKFFHDVFKAGRDHPRACGEKCRCSGRCKTWSGSPPRMRGKDAMNKKYGDENRITPAHAGKRKARGPAAGYDQDHPRACGEKSGSAAAIATSMGSPPRMRGKVAIPTGGTVEARITPAHAGKRLLQARL